MMMIKRLIFLSICAFHILMVSTVSAQQDTLEHALLWRIEGAELPSPSYLFGTIHLIDADDFLLSDSLMAALNRSENLILELDPEEMMSPGTQMQMMMSAFMPEGQKLQDFLTDEEYEKVQAKVSAIGIPTMFTDRIKPMFLSIITSMDPNEIKGMIAGDGENASMKSYELELSSIAKASEKTVSGLETPAFQISLFDSIPLPEQAKMLMKSLDSGLEDEDPLKALVDVYTSGNINKMYSMTITDEEDGSNFEQFLLVNRNKNWITPIKEQAAKAPTVFAVGAAHLGGPDGVIRLLMKEGYTLVPVSKR